MGELNKNEIERVVSKIRIEYSALAKENPSMFTQASIDFEKRYTEVLIKKVNIDRFLKDEVGFLDQLKTKYHQLKEKKKNTSEQPTINRIIDQNMERIQKYPKIDFHPAAKTEIKHFYGALIDFANTELQFLYKIFRGTPEMNSIIEHIYLIEKVGLQRKGKLSSRMTEHATILQESYSNAGAIERECQLLLRETCRALRFLSDGLVDVTLNRKVKTETVLKFTESDPKELQEKYPNLTYGEAIKLVVNKAQDIVVDFRMDSIVGLERDKANKL